MTGDGVMAYDAVEDSLTILIGESMRPHMTDDANAWISILYDIDDCHAFGFRIHNFLADGANEWPRLKELAKYAGLIPRAKGDFRLFADRYIREEVERDSSMEESVKYTLTHLIEVTGGPEMEIRVSIE